VTIPGGVLGILDGVDLSAHAERIAREIARLERELERLRAKLANAAFVANAPAELVAAEREKLGRLRAERGAL
jgi:valyl-tRNA synthetase